jgi:hypothetical protein
VALKPAALCPKNKSGPSKGLRALVQSTQSADPKSRGIWCEPRFGARPRLLTCLASLDFLVQRSFVSRFAQPSRLVRTLTSLVRSTLTFFGCAHGSFAPSLLGLAWCLASCLASLDPHWFRTGDDDLALAVLYGAKHTPKLVDCRAHFVRTWLVRAKRGRHWVRTTKSALVVP